MLFTRWLEPPHNRQNLRRGSSLESSRLVDNYRSQLEPTRDLSPLVDPCSICRRDRLPRDSIRLVAPPGSQGFSQARLESGSSPLGSCTTLTTTLLTLNMTSKMQCLYCSGVRSLNPNVHASYNLFHSISYMDTPYNKTFSLILHV